MTSLLPTGSRPDTVTLRSAKSEESLSSQASGAGEHRMDPTCARVELGGPEGLVWGGFVTILRLGLAMLL